MPLDFIDDKSALVQVMAGCRQATSHYLSQCWPRARSPYGVTRPQWVNMLKPRKHGQHFADGRIWLFFYLWMVMFKFRFPGISYHASKEQYASISLNNGLALVRQLDFFLKLRWQSLLTHTYATPPFVDQYLIQCTNYTNSFTHCPLAYANNHLQLNIG